MLSPSLRTYSLSFDDLRASTRAASTSRFAVSGCFAALIFDGDDVDEEGDIIDVGADEGRCSSDIGATSAIAAWATELGGSRGLARRTTGVFGVVGPPLREGSLVLSLENVMLGTLHCAARSPDVSKDAVSV